MSDPTVSDDTALLYASKGSTVRLRAAGEWVAREAARLEPLTRSVPSQALGAPRVELDLTEVTRIDTLGAKLIDQIRAMLTAAGTRVEITTGDDAQRVLLAEVASHRLEPASTRRAHNGFVDLLSEVGQVIRGIGRDVVGMNAFLGEIIVAAGRLLTGRARLRTAAIVTQLELVAFRGVPIIVLISFLVGAIVSQQTIFQLERFGATLFVVDLLGILMLREVGLLLTSIMVAGRSGSAITAELGSMKMREEVDAMRVMGLDPMEVLILPRILALVIGLPLLTFLASLSGICGGGLVAWLYGGVTPATFLERLRDAIAINTFMVGLIKAPVMALTIGVISCIEGMKVEGSAESLGRQTTSSVVKSIFTVIVVDGLFAMFFASIRY
jgi:phospholipid/cholesterol/gamma-HCH transport system permease protein